LAFTAAVATATALVFGILPALTAAPPALGLRDADRAATVGGGRAPRPPAPGHPEGAPSPGLLVRPPLPLRGPHAHPDRAPGLGARRRWRVTVGLPGTGSWTPAGRAAFYRRVVDELRASAAIEAAGGVTRLPLGSGNSSRDVVMEGRKDPLHVDLRIATPGYL